MIRPRVLLFCSMPLLCVIAAAGFVAAAEVTSKPLHWTEGGTPDAPTVFDGGGLVIDLGIDVTDHPWDRKDDL
jgi:hypothetical protein